jgi:hypothetical protein
MHGMSYLLVEANSVVVDTVDTDDDEDDDDDDDDVDELVSTEPWNTACKHDRINAPHTEVIFKRLVIMWSISRRQK